MSSEKQTDFSKVVLGSYDQSECSPTFEQFNDKVRGIRINAPAKVKAVFDGDGVSPESRIPLCVAMQFQADFFAKYDHVYSRITIVAVDEATGKSYSGNLALSRPVMPPKRNPSIPPEKLAAMTQRKYINVNLANYLHLPPAKGTYVVYATIEDNKSNTVTIELE